MQDICSYRQSSVATRPSHFMVSKPYTENSLRNINVSLRQSLTYVPAVVVIGSKKFFLLKLEVQEIFEKCFE